MSPKNRTETIEALLTVFQSKVIRETENLTAIEMFSEQSKYGKEIRAIQGDLERETQKAKQDLLSFIERFC